jgi:putative ABC transport system permease protein
MSMPTAQEGALPSNPEPQNSRALATKRKNAASRRGRGMMIGAGLESGLEALWANRLRSLLTVLGVIVGVAAVIAVVTLTQGTSQLLNSRLTGLGTNVLTITPGSTTTGGVASGLGARQSLTGDDASAVATVPNITGVTPVITVSAQVIAGAQNWNTRVQGVTPDMQQIQNWEMTQGAWFTAVDNTAQTPVAVIGQTVVDNLFTAAAADPLGQTITIRSQPFRVVGVLKSKGSNGFANQDDVIYIPFTVARTRLNNSQYVNQILAQVNDANNVNAAQAAITTLLEQRHNITDSSQDDFQVRSSTQFVQTAQQFSTTLTLLLVGIAAISLLVGGIGIMNIMLVSVTERTREIGIRMAIGARRADIRNQFLIEALTLSCTGGVIGILIGLIGGWALTNAFSLPFIASLPWIALAFGVAALVGIVFGFYPAIRASQLDPIVALRTE